MQTYEHPELTAADYDKERTMRVVAYRVPQAPILDKCWRRFDSWAAALRLSGGRAVAFKVGCDQLLCAPLMAVCFFMSQSTMEGHSLADGVERTQRALWPTWQRGLLYYGSIHCLTFSVVPPSYRIAWNSCAAVVWTAYLSHCNQELRRGGSTSGP